jgi:hypothetical protein
VIFLYGRYITAQDAEIDLTHLPIGDGRVTTDEPMVGYVYSCTDRFGGGGAFAAGDWIHDDGTFDLTAKPFVDGEILWPSDFEITLVNEVRMVVSNTLPAHPTGIFPVGVDDDAFDYDRNPNSIRAQEITIELPANPTTAAQPGCLALGPIGIMLTGSIFFNALDARGEDAVAHEIQDACQGHPERMGWLRHLWSLW